MKKSGERIVLAIVILVLSFLCIAFAEETTPSIADNSSTPEKAFIAIQTAIENNDYDKAWQMSSSSFKQKFNGSIEQFKKELTNSPMRLGILSSEVQSVNLLSPDKAKMQVSIFFVINHLMLLEDGVWKFAGKAEENR